MHYRVSQGVGKSTLINNTLYHSLAKHLYKSNLEVSPHKEIKGFDFFDKVVDVNQSPIGRTPRSNPATYTGLFTPIEIYFQKFLKANLEAMLLADFHLMLKEVDVSHVRETVS
jgi:excinuclease UvrABC ATPase subunit